MKNPILLPPHFVRLREAYRAWVASELAREVAIDESLTIKAEQDEAKEFAANYVSNR